MHEDNHSFFDQERQKYAEDIAKVRKTRPLHDFLSHPPSLPTAQSFEQLLDGTNALNRKLEEFTAPSIRNELRSVADLWIAFKNLMQRPREQKEDGQQQLGQLGMPGTGGFVAGQSEQ